MIDYLEVRNNSDFSIKDHPIFFEICNFIIKIALRDQEFNNKIISLGGPNNPIVHELLLNVADTIINSNNVLMQEGNILFDYFYINKFMFDYSLACQDEDVKV